MKEKWGTLFSKRPASSERNGDYIALNCQIPFLSSDRKYPENGYQVEKEDAGGFI